MKLRTLLTALFLLSLTTTSALANGIEDRHIEYPTYFAPANGLSIAYQDFGNPQDPAILLVMGLGGQLIQWKDDFVLGLVEQGFRVIRFDNRDIGLSEKLYKQGTPGIFTGIRFKLGMSLNAPYHLDDMAADSIGLMDHLGIQQAHVVGISMGGMISQIMAASYPDRILSLTSIMSSTSRKGLPEGTFTPSMRDREDMSREQIVAEISNILKAIDGGHIELSEEQWLRRAARGYDRNHYDEGYARQFWAILDSGDRIELLNSIKQPSLVIHGKNDPLLPLEHGQDTADNIPGSTFLVLDDMGHYMDTLHHPRVIAAMMEMIKQ